MQQIKIWLKAATYNFLIFLSPIVSAQPANTLNAKVTISSPNAASLGKFGDIPVNYHTGIPNIDIPIYTVKAGSIILPITLSYHASGLKVQEQASWVGAGWALDAGGVITRTVIGAPDDKGLDAAYTQKGHFTDYGYNSYLFSVGPATCGGSPLPCPQGRSGMTPSNYPPQDNYIQSGIFDGEPDLYFFNFNGYSGKFYFNDDRTPVIVPEQDLKIIPIYPGNDWRGITGFVITTPDGTQYYFGKNQNNDGNIDAIEVTYNVSTQNTFTGQGATSAWYLNKIVSADSQFTIVLTYQSESISYYTLSMFPIPAVRNPNWWAYNHEYDLDKNFINAVRLSKIIFPNGEVNFTPGSLRQDMSKGLGPFPNYNYNGLGDLDNTDAVLGGRTLGSISISSTDFCKKDSFYTSYFYDGTGLTGDLFATAAGTYNLHSDQYRLRLDSIQEITCDGMIKIPPYRFSYYSGTVPRKLSFGVDHWGFYNGASQNTGLIPTYTKKSDNSLAGVVTIIPGADRDTHWPYSKGGALQQIKYPTGGTTTFDYESNKVYTATPSYEKTLVASFSAGFSGPSTLVTTGTFTSSTNSNTYELDMWSNQPSNQGGGTLSGLGSDSYFVGPGQSNTFHFTLSPSTTYNWTFTDNNNSQQISGYGITAQLYELVPTTIYANSDVGGLRVKTITNNDGITSNNIVTTYGYNYNNNNSANGQSSATLYSIPTYVQPLRNDAWGTVNGETCSQPGCFTCFGSDVSYYQSPSSLRPMNTSQGNHIGYGEVYVSQTNNGYSKYVYYSNNGIITGPWTPPIPDVCTRSLTINCSSLIPNSPAPPVQFDPMRGELASVSHFNQNNQLLKKTSYYPVWQYDSLITPGIISKFYVTAYTYNQPLGGTTTDPELNLSSGSYQPIGVETITEYFLQSAKKIKDSVVTATYDLASSNYLTDVNATYFGSSYHHQPTRMLSVSSKGENRITNYKNSFDFRISNFNLSDQLPTYYNNLNIDNSYVSNAYATFTTSPTDPYYYWDRLYIYCNWRYMKAVDRQTYIASRLNYNSVYSQSFSDAKSSAGTELKPILELQDVYQNAVIEQTDWKDNKLLRANFSRYDYTTNPSEKVFLNKLQAINLATPSTTITNAEVSGNTLIKDSRYLDESYFSFDKGNPIQITPHSGITNSYIWGYNNAFPVVEAINAKHNEIYFSDFEKNGWNSPVMGGYTLSAYDDARAHTGKYSGRIDNSGPSEKVVHSDTWLNISISQPTKFKYSGWIYSTGPSAEIFLFMKSATEQGYYTYVSSVGTSTVNKWVYIEGEYTVPTNITKLNIRIDNNSPGTVWFDDIKIYPSSAQMATYTYNPLAGITSKCDVNNIITYYEYDGLGRLVVIRDQDKYILKKFCYNNKGQQENCTVNTNPLWQSTGNYRCLVDVTGNNTGYQQREERDNNPNSSTYNQLRWVDNGYNTTACPLPCDSYNCSSQGEDFACINGQCEEGYRVNTGSYYDYLTGMYECIYHYEFSDGSWSQDYSEWSYYPCAI